MLCANIELADSTDESAEDITAADTAPSPTKATAVGIKYCKTSGSTNLKLSSLMLLVLFSMYLVGIPTADQSKHNELHIMNAEKNRR